MRIPEGVQKLIAVDQTRIKANGALPRELRQPPISIKLPGERNQEILAMDIVSVEGPSFMAYDPEHKSHGASCWIETWAAVTVADDSEVRELPDYSEANR